jgi:hypothetical protein
LALLLATIKPTGQRGHPGRVRLSYLKPMRSRMHFISAFCDLPVPRVPASCVCGCPTPRDVFAPHALPEVRTEAAAGTRQARLSCPLAERRPECPSLKPSELSSQAVPRHDPEFRVPALEFDDIGAATAGRGPAGLMARTQHRRPEPADSWVRTPHRRSEPAGSRARTPHHRQEPAASRALTAHRWPETTGSGARTTHSSSEPTGSGVRM